VPGRELSGEEHGENREIAGGEVGAHNQCPAGS
jgi:hypothetical protein